MGVDYYIVNHARRAGFECGKDSLWKGEFDPGMLTSREGMDLWVDDIYSDRESYPLPVWCDGYVKEIARRLEIFIGKEDPGKLSVVTDDEWYNLEGQGYKVTCGRFLGDEFDYSDLKE